MSTLPSYPRVLAAVATLVLLAGCGGGRPVDEKGREVAEWVVGKGGTVIVAGSDVRRSRLDQLPDGPLAIRGIDLAGRGIVDRDLKRLEGLQHLRDLNLYQSKVGDKGLDAIAPLHSLVTLELSYTPITDQGLAKLASLRRLEKLYVRGTAVTEEGANALAKQISGLRIERR
jgi:hypothetical protein